MVEERLSHHKVLALPEQCEPNAMYFVARGDDAYIPYVTDGLGIPRRQVSEEVTSPVVLMFDLADTWTINHELRRQPAAVTLLTPGGVEILADVVHVSVNQCVATFSTPRAGRAVVF